MKAKVACAAFLLAVAMTITGLSDEKAVSQPLQDLTFCSQGDTRPCPDMGICKNRVKVCENGKWSQTCTGGTGPGPAETCDNGLDDNCNGQVDECVSLSGSVGIFLIIGGFILLIVAIALSRVFK